MDVENQAQYLNLLDFGDLLGEENAWACRLCLAQLNGEIFQCRQGHWLCGGCHRRIGSEGRCPTCSERIGDIRCRLAEMLVASRDASIPAPQQTQNMGPAGLGSTAGPGLAAFGWAGPSLSDSLPPTLGSRMGFNHTPLGIAPTFTEQGRVDSHIPFGDDVPVDVTGRTKVGVIGDGRVQARVPPWEDDEGSGLRGGQLLQPHFSASTPGNLTAESRMMEVDGRQKSKSLVGGSSDRLNPHSVLPDTLEAAPLLPDGFLDHGFDLHGVPSPHFDLPVGSSDLHESEPLEVEQVGAPMISDRADGTNGTTQFVEREKAINLDHRSKSLQGCERTAGDARSWTEPARESPPQTEEVQQPEPAAVEQSRAAQQGGSALRHTTGHVSDRHKKASSRERSAEKRAREGGPEKAKVTRRAGGKGEERRDWTEARSRHPKDLDRKKQDTGPASRPPAAAGLSANIKSSNLNRRWSQALMLSVPVVVLLVWAVSWVSRNSLAELGGQVLSQLPDLQLTWSLGALSPMRSMQTQCVLAAECASSTVVDAARRDLVPHRVPRPLRLVLTLLFPFVFRPRPVLPGTVGRPLIKSLAPALGCRSSQSPAASVWPSTSTSSAPSLVPGGLSSAVVAPRVEPSLMWVDSVVPAATPLSHTAPPAATGSANCAGIVRPRKSGRAVARERGQWKVSRVSGARNVPDDWQCELPDHLSRSMWQHPVANVVVWVYHVTAVGLSALDGQPLIQVTMSDRNPFDSKAWWGGGSSCRGRGFSMLLAPHLAPLAIDPLKNWTAAIRPGALVQIWRVCCFDPPVNPKNPIRREPLRMLMDLRVLVPSPLPFPDTLLPPIAIPLCHYQEPGWAAGWLNRLLELERGGQFPSLTAYLTRNRELHRKGVQREAMADHKHDKTDRWLDKLPPGPLWQYQPPPDIPNFSTLLPIGPHSKSLASAAQCPVCGLLAAHLWRSVRRFKEELNNGQLPSLEISAMMVLACNLTQSPGEWITHIDVINSKNGTVMLKLEEDSGMCRRECLAIKSACEAILHPGVLEEVKMLMEQSFLSDALSENNFHRALCFELTPACHYPRSVLRRDRKNEQFLSWRRHADEFAKELIQAAFLWDVDADGLTLDEFRNYTRYILPRSEVEVVTAFKLFYAVVLRSFGASDHIPPDQQWRVPRFFSPHPLQKMVMEAMLNGDMDFEDDGRDE